MRATEFISEDLSRRGFLQGAAGLAAAAAVTPSLAGEFQRWDKWYDDPKLTKVWEQRFRKLSDRLDRVVKRLFSVLPPAQKSKFSNLEFTVSQTSASAMYNFTDNSVKLDLSIFWDLSDDAIGYAIGHELGHAYYNHNGIAGYTKQELYQQELLADAYGAKLAYKAGYDPSKCFPDFTQLEKKATTGGESHPAYRDRVTHIKKETGITVSHINRGLQYLNVPLSQIAQA